MHTYAKNTDVDGRMRSVTKIRVISPFVQSSAGAMQIREAMFNLSAINNLGLTPYIYGPSAHIFYDFNRAELSWNQRVSKATEREESDFDIHLAAVLHNGHAKPKKQNCCLKPFCMFAL